MKHAGITIYIAPSVETLTNRLMKSKTERPLIIGKSRDELLQFIEKALVIRAPFYEQAQIIIRGKEDLNPEEVLDEIIKQS